MDKKPAAAKTGSTLLDLESLIRKAGELDMMPQVARKVMQLVADQNANATQLADVLEKDANITTRILKIANSAFYGLRREVKSVQQAIVILGFRTLRSMVVASSSKSLHKRFGIAEQLMWDHSIGSAIGAKLIAAKLSPIVGELSFVGGLLHNVGKTIMNNECQQQYNEVMQLVYNDGLSPIDAEIAVFKYAHPEVGFRVTEKWGLPQELSQIIRYHHLSHMKVGEQLDLKPSEDLQNAMACVEMATTICRSLGIGFRDKKADLDLMNLASAKILKAEEIQIKTWAKDIEEAFLKERAIFN